MDSFKDFINVLSPAQIPFKSRNPPPETSDNLSSKQTHPLGLFSSSSCSQTSPPLTPNESDDPTLLAQCFSLVSQLHLSDNEMVVIENTGTNSLYTSFLSLILPQYNLLSSYSQKCEIIGELIHFLITQMETVCRRWSPFRSGKINEIIRNPQQHHIDAIYCLVVVFDINLLVLVGDHVELYYRESEVDVCKPYLLLCQNQFGIYHPCIYQKKSFLNYYEDHIVTVLSQLPGLIEWNHTIYEN